MNNPERGYVRIGLADQRPLSEQEAKRARSISEQIKALVDSRAAIIHARGIDPEFGLPDANWANDEEAFFFRTYRYALQGDYATFNTLRLFVPFFSGYNLQRFTWHKFCAKLPVEPIPDDYDTQLPTLLPSPDTDAIVTRWNLMTSMLPAGMVARPPQMLGEIGWDLEGVIVNHDTVVYQERLNLLMEAGILDLLRWREQQGKTLRILEIGGGYGALAYFLKQLLPNATYTICDLPESLLFSSLYLGLTAPQAPHSIYDGSDRTLLQGDTADFRFVPNYLFRDLLEAGEHFDLVLNTLSMSEMSEHQVRTYASGIGELIGLEGVFFEQNQDNAHAGFHASKEYLADYFPCRASLTGMTLPGLTEGKADAWSNTPLSEMAELVPASHGEWENYRGATVQAYLNAIVEELSEQKLSADRAIDRLLKVLSVSDRIAPIACKVGEMLCRQGAALASVRLFEGLLQACPNEAIYHTRYGEALFAAGCIANARTAFLRASELAPEQAEIQNNLGVACWELGEQTQALRYVETAHRLDPGYADAAANLTAMRSALAVA